MFSPLQLLLCLIVVINKNQKFVNSAITSLLLALLHCILLLKTFSPPLSFYLENHERNGRYIWSY